MGKVLRREHIDFFTTKMDEHNLVNSWDLIENEGEYLFRIRRTLSGSKSDVIVHLTDAYRYGLAEFYARPDQLQAGSYVVIGMPHADAAADVIETAKLEHIGIGDIGKFMGALNHKNIWEYISPKEAEQQRRRAGK